MAVPSIRRAEFEQGKIVEDRVAVVIDNRVYASRQIVSDRPWLRQNVCRISPFPGLREFHRQWFSRAFPGRFFHQGRIVEIPITGQQQNRAGAGKKNSRFHDDLLFQKPFSILKSSGYPRATHTKQRWSADVEQIATSIRMPPRLTEGCGYPPDMDDQAHFAPKAGFPSRAWQAKSRCGAASTDCGIACSSGEVSNDSQ